MEGQVLVLLQERGALSRQRGQAHVTVRNALTGKTRTFLAAQVDSTYYAARIVFPSRGRWTVDFSFGLEMGGGSRRLTMLRIV